MTGINHSTGSFSELRRLFVVLKKKECHKSDSLPPGASLTASLAHFSNNLVYLLIHSNHPQTVCIWQEVNRSYTG
jgi:hypothetical protein